MAGIRVSMGVLIPIPMPRRTPGGFFATLSICTALGTRSTMGRPAMGFILGFCLIGAALGLIGFTLRLVRLTFRTLSAVLCLFGFALLPVCPVLGLFLTLTILTLIRTRLLLLFLLTRCVLLKVKLCNLGSGNGFRAFRSNSCKRKKCRKTKCCEQFGGHDSSISGFRMPR
jgi:hypothetical protein